MTLLYIQDIILITLPSNLDFHFIKKENHRLGEITLKTNFGYDVKTYDLERITCDIISSKKLILKRTSKQIFKKSFSRK